MSWNSYTYGVRRNRSDSQCTWHSNRTHCACRDGLSYHTKWYWSVNKKSQSKRNFHYINNPCSLFADHDSFTVQNNSVKYKLLCLASQLQSEVHGSMIMYVRMALDSCPTLLGFRPVGCNKTFLHTIPIPSVKYHVVYHRLETVLSCRSPLLGHHHHHHL